MRTFEGMAKHLFSKVMNVEFEGDFQRMTYADAMRLYGSDKPDLRFGMPFVELNDLCKDKGFKVFDDAELVLTIAVPACAEFTRKQLDALTEWVKRPQVGAKGLVYVKYAADGSLKSSVDKFYSADDLKLWADKAEAKPGDLLLVLSGDTDGIRKAMGELRLQVAADLGLRDKNKFAPLWVVDFPLLEFDPESGRYHAMHHPFTAPKPEDLELMETNPGAVRAKAYDFVINGSEIGGGSIRIHDTDLQALMFKHLGFTPEEARAQFGFLMDAFKYGAPPHGGAAFGFDRWVTLFTKTDSIREVIAFPKNNAGRDVMIDAPSLVSSAQLRELRLDIVEDKK
jgi:aspartyl-tRNA synthetase